jgi:hypothetical protein
MRLFRAQKRDGSMSKMMIASAFLFLSVQFALAGQIVGRATQDFCQVVITICNAENPSACPIVFNGAMQQGATYTSNTGFLCYRRSNDPTDCRSGLETNWNCYSNSLGQTEQTEIH